MTEEKAKGTEEIQETEDFDVTDVVAVQTEEPEAGEGTSWDQTRQFRDELASANRREGEIRAELKNSNEQSTRMKTELAELKEKLESQGDVPSNADLNDYDNLVRTLTQEQARGNQLQLAMKDSSDQLKQTQESLKDLQDRVEKQTRAEQERESKKAVSDICDKFDAVYGAELRNSVMNAVRKQFEDQDVASMSVPAQNAWITNTLELQYIKQKAVAKKTSVKKKGPGVVVDTGTGGNAPADKIEEGSFRETAAKMNERDKRKYG